MLNRRAMSENYATILIGFIQRVRLVVTAAAVALVAAFLAFGLAGCSAQPEPKLELDYDQGTTSPNGPQKDVRPLKDADFDSMTPEEYLVWANDLVYMDLSESFMQTDAAFRKALIFETVNAAYREQGQPELKDMTESLGDVPDQQLSSAEEYFIQTDNAYRNKVVALIFSVCNTSQRQYLVKNLGQDPALQDPEVQALLPDSDGNYPGDPDYNLDADNGKTDGTDGSGSGSDTGTGDSGSGDSGADDSGDITADDLVELFKDHLAPSQPQEYTPVSWSA